MVSSIVGITLHLTPNQILFSANIKTRNADQKLVIFLSQKTKNILTVNTTSNPQELLKMMKLTRALILALLPIVFPGSNIMRMIIFQSNQKLIVLMKRLLNFRILLIKYFKNLIFI